MGKLNMLARKLQKALSAQGRHILISQNEFYSAKIDKICTKYVVKEHDGYKCKTLLETFKMVNVVLFLVEELKEGDSP